MAKNSHRFWTVLVPGDALPLQFGFSVPVEEAVVRQMARRYLGVSILPYGTVVLPAIPAPRSGH